MLKPKFMAVIPLALTGSMLIPNVAYAGIFDDLSNWVEGFMVDIGITLWNAYFGIIGSASDTSTIVGSFTTLFGNDSVWNLAKTAHSTVVIPLGESILALFMLVQLVKISQRIDATATLPAVKDIVFLAVAYVLFHWLIINSLDIISAIYSEFNKIAASFVGENSLVSSALDKAQWDADQASIGGCALFIVMGFFSMCVGFIAYVVSLVVALARGIQLYAMAAFSPIPLSLLGFDETRQMGIGFLKNFCAAALAGAIMVFLMVAYPFIVTSIGGSPTAGNTIFALTYEGEFIDTVGIVLGWIATSFMLIIGLVKSGAWARRFWAANRLPRKCHHQPKRGGLRHRPFSLIIYYWAISRALERSRHAKLQRRTGGRRPSQRRHGIRRP